MEPRIKRLAVNREARHEYFIEDSLEAGIELFGTEVKSIRLGKVNLKESFAQLHSGQIFVEGMHISPYEKGNIFNRDPLRPKRLLLHKQEILKLSQLVQRQGYTLIPLTMYLKNSLVKLELGICKGKKLYDKREDAAQRSAQRDMERAYREDNKRRNYE